MSTPSIALIPSGYKESKVYSQLPVNGDGDLTFARTGTSGVPNATRVNEQGLIEGVNADVPRLDYSDGDCPGLLLEPSSTNLYENSEPTSIEGAESSITYESFSWANGFTNCVKFGDNSITRFRYGGNVVNGNTYTLSAFVIMDDLSEPIISNLNNVGDFKINIGNNTSDGDIHPNKDMGNNIWRVSKTRTVTQTSFLNGVVKFATSSAKGFRIVGWQLEEQSYATSYIPTNGTIETRTAETLSKSGLSDYINSSEGVLYAELKSISEESDADRYIYLGDNTSTHDNFVSIFYKSTGDELAAYGVRNSNESFYIATTDYTLTDNLQVAVKWKENDCQLYVNGNLVGTDISTQDFDFTFTDLKTRKFLGESFYGNIKDLRVYDTALTDTELIDLTS